MWSALASGDAVADSQLLADDFWGVYSSGFANKLDHTNQLKEGPTIISWDISKARIKELSNEAVVLSYFVTYSSFEGGTVSKSKSMYVSSIWQCFHGVWKNVFSQDTLFGD